MKKQTNTAYENIVKNVWGYVKNNRVSMAEMAASTGRISESSLYHRLRSPGDFRLSELVALANKMDITMGELLGLETPEYMEV